MHRREWLQMLGAGVAGIATSCGDNLPQPPATISAAILEPHETGFLVALFDENVTSVAVEVRDDAGDIVVVEIVGLAPTGVAVIDGLHPGSAYDVFAVQPGRAVLGPLRVRTAPTPDDARRVRIAVSADYDPNPEFRSALVDHLIAAAPDLYVSLGDFPYCDDGPQLAMDVAGYRMRHYQARSSPTLLALHANVGVRAIYDDHEFRNNWDSDSIARESARYLAAMQVWDEFFPLRDSAGNIRYRSWRYGAHAECFLLDCRRFRSASADADTVLKTMLGPTQRRWLHDSVRASTATFKLIFTSVPLDYGSGFDHWNSYATERDELLATLRGVSGVLFVSADQHYFAAHRHAWGVREIQVGPFARGIGTYGSAAPGVLFRAGRYNVGLFDIDGDVLRVTGLGADGERFYEETLTPALLTPT